MHDKAFTPKDALAKRQDANNATEAVHMTVDECKSYAKECRATYQDTFVAWDFLVDLKVPERLVRLVDRFNMSREYLHELVGATKEEDVVRAVARSSRGSS
jgi:hypothetical protein